MRMRRVAEVAVLFVGVLALLLGLGVAGAAFLLYLLGGGIPALWYLAVGAGFVTVGMLALRSRQFAPAPTEAGGVD